MGKKPSIEDMIRAGIDPEELDDIVAEDECRRTRTGTKPGTSGMSSERSRKEKRRERALRAEARARKSSQVE